VIACFFSFTLFHLFSCSDIIKSIPRNLLI